MSLLRLFALLWCNQLNSQTQALLWLHSPGHTFSGVHPNCFLVTPENSINLLGMNKIMVLSEVTFYTSLCLLNLRASEDFHWERKIKQTKKNVHMNLRLTFTFLFFSFFLPHWMNLKGREWSESLQSHMITISHYVYTWLSVTVGPDLGLWSFFPL